MRNVIVTGGSRGLGLGIARALGGAGYRVIAIARRESEQLAAAIREAQGGGRGSLHFSPFDLAKIGELANLVKGIRNEYGPVYGLINNAGIGTSGVLATMREEQIERLVHLNTVSPILLTKHVVRAMMVDGGGRIVN